MEEYYYYIEENMRSSDKQKNLPYRYSISKYPIDYLFLPNTQKYTSLRNLKRNSLVYDVFKKENSKGARKICEDAFITEVKGVIMTPSNSEFDKHSFDLLLHTIHGKIEKNFSGIHLICKTNKNIRNIKETKPADLNGVWEAEVTVYSESKNKEFSKISTLFPKNWTPTDFMYEIHFAIEKMKQKKDKKYILESITKSGVPVEIVRKGDKIRSVYPLHKGK